MNGPDGLGITSVFQHGSLWHVRKNKIGFEKWSDRLFQVFTNKQRVPNVKTQINILTRAYWNFN